MKKLMITLLGLCLITCALGGCGKKYTCGGCGKSFTGTAYTNGGGKAILCNKCATQYWNPFPISEHKYLGD